MAAKKQANEKNLSASNQLSTRDTWLLSHGDIEQHWGDGMVLGGHWLASHIESWLHNSALKMEFQTILSGIMSKSFLQKSRDDQKFLTSHKGNQQATSSFYLFKALNNLNWWHGFGGHWSASHIESCWYDSTLEMEFHSILSGIMSKSWPQKSRTNQKILTSSKGNPLETRSTISSRHWTSWEWWHGFGWTLMGQSHWFLVA